MRRSEWRRLADPKYLNSLVPLHSDYDSLVLGSWTGGWFWVGAAHFGAGFLSCEHPFDASARGIALSFPGSDLGYEFLLGGDAPVEALTAQHADLDLDHVQPAGMLWDIVELQSAQHPAGLARGKGLVECAGRMRR